MVQLGPVHRLVEQGGTQGVHPAPAFVNLDAAVQVLRVEHLEEALGTAFLADQGAVAFGEGGGRQHQVGAVEGRGLGVVGNDHYLGGGQGGIDLGSRYAGVQVVFQHDDGVGLAADDRVQGGVDGLAAHHRHAEAVGLRHDQAQRTVLLAQLEGLGDVGGGFDQRWIRQGGAGDHQRAVGGDQGVGDALGQGLGFLVQAGDGRRARVDGVGHGETDAGEVSGSGVYTLFGDVVQLGFSQGCDEQRVQRVLADVLHRGVQPRLYAHGVGHGLGFALGGLAHGQGEAGGGLGQVFAEHEHGVVVFDVAQGRDRQRAVIQHVQRQSHAGQFASFHARVEVLGADQLTQAVVALEAGAWRADADDGAAAQQVGGLVQGGVQAQLAAIGEERLAWTVLAVDVAITEAATVAQEVLVHRAVEAVLDAAQFAVALAGADVAAAGAAMADARGELHVPLAVVALGVGLVGEHTGRADLGEVAGELAFQHAVFDATEIHVVVGAIHAQVGAASVVLVVAHAAVAGDAAVHLMSDERAEVLVLVGTLGETVAALVVAGHYRHVLQVAVTAFLAHRAVVRVVGHQPFDDAGAKRLGLFIVDGNPGAVGGRGHAGHDDTTTGVVLVGVLLDRALPAGADATERRVPAEIGDVEAERQTGL